MRVPSDELWEVRYKMAISLYNLASAKILNNLTSLSSQLVLSNERLATAKRINRAADDPAGVVALSQMNNEIARIDAATSNGQRIVNLLDTADGGLSEISDLLDSIDTQLIAASDAGATADEKAAAQVEIDAAIDAINTIVNETTFSGNRLLDGSLGYAVSGVTSTDVSNIRINAANVDDGSQTVTISVTAIAEKANLTYAGGGLGQDTDFTLTGNKGSYDFSFSNGTSVATMVSTINDQTDTTGVTATNNGGNLLLESENYGSDQFFSVNVTQGSLPLTGGATSDYGVDPTVSVDGLTATATGLKLSYSSSSLSFRLDLQEAFATAVGSTTFDIDGGGKKFQLNTNAHTRIDLGVGSLTAANLGSSAVGFLNTLKTGGTNSVQSGNFNTAREIVSEGSGLVAYERGRLGAISNYSVTAVTNAMASTKTELTSAVSNIEDLDIALETANNTRLQALLDVNTTLLATLGSNMNNLFSLITGKALS